MKKDTNKPFKLLKGDWYFEGYTAEMVPRKHGNGMKRKFIYVGTFYSFDRDIRAIRRLKGSFVLLFLLVLSSYLALNFVPFSALAFYYVGVPLILCVIPILYLGMGVGCLCFVPMEMTVRNCYSSVRRMKRAVCIALAFSAMTMIGDFVFLITFHGNHFPSEYLFPGINALLLIVLSGIWYLLLKNPLKPLRKERGVTVPVSSDED